jgi:hypothetical protein
MEITLELPEIDVGGLSTEQLVDRYVEQMRPLLARKVQEMGERSKPGAAIRDPFQLSYAEFARMTDAEQERLRCEALQCRGQLVDAELARHKAAWVLLIGGAVVSSGPGLDSVPSKADVYWAAEQRGWAPFLFSVEPLIEESAETPWTSTWSVLAQDDSYPTIPVLLCHPAQPAPTSAAEGLHFLADFDTGSPAVFLNQHDVRQCAVPLDNLMPMSRLHLGRPYHYVIPTVQLAIPTKAGQLCSDLFQVYAVRDWEHCPLTHVNPKRRALVGRDVLLRLRLEVTLNGRTRATTVLG